MITAVYGYDPQSAPRHRWTIVGPWYVDHDGAAPSLDEIERFMGVDLESVRARGKRDVDMAAELERSRHITQGSGQALVYQRKAVERMAYMSAAQMGAPITRDAFPMLFSSVGIDVPATGDDAADIGAVAAVVGQREAAWASIVAAIEHRRLTAKAAIAAATTRAEIEAAIQTFKGN